MRKNNKKGFTIVELVIVIAVIAILAGVLIPTFAGIVNKAQNSAIVQEANVMYKNYTANVNYAEGDTAEQNLVIEVPNDKGAKFVVVKEAQMQDEVYDSEAAAVKGAELGADYALLKYTAKDDDNRELVESTKHVCADGEDEDKLCDICGKEQP